MMRKLLPILLALIGLASGTGAGWMLQPAAGGGDETGEAAHDAVPEAAEDEHAAEGNSEGGQGHELEYVKMSNQDGRVASMVVMSLSLEVTAGSSEAVFAKEPKLRDSFLQILFDHANAGGFKGSFTDGANLIVLRRSLLEAAAKAVGDKVTDVLIADIARQDS
jgi:flagellar protein FliL